MANPNGGQPETFEAPEWTPLPGYEQAACKDRDVVDFFPEGNSATIWSTKMDCFWCPLGSNGGVDGKLAGTCLSYALTMEDGTPQGRRFGVWGGTTPSDRIKISRGELDPANLYGECGHCGDPMPAASGMGRQFCTRKCREQARWLAKKEEEEAA